ATEELHDPEDRTGPSNGKTEGCMKPFFRRDGQTREIVILEDIRNPKGLATRPDTAWQPRAAGKSSLLAERRKRCQAAGGRMPDFTTANDAGLLIDAPKRTHFPVKALADGLQKFGGHFAKRRRLGQKTSHGMLRVQAPFPLLALRDVANNPCKAASFCGRPG